MHCYHSKESNKGNTSKRQEERPRDTTGTQKLLKFQNVSSSQLSTIQGPVTIFNSRDAEILKAETRDIQFKTLH